jgi:predicted nucleic acid-binding protein
MCLIVDANAAHKFLVHNSAVIEWLLQPKGKPRLCTGGQLTVELEIIGDVRRLLLTLDQAGRLRKISDKETLKGGKQLKTLRSNDVHVLALAIASGARTLATFDDKLSADFKDARIINRPRGKVYQHPDKQAHLLSHTPKSCGVHPK